VKRILSDVADPRKEMAAAACSKVVDVNTFASIGKLIGRGRGFVSKRMLPMFEADPRIMCKIGSHYSIPRSTAERFIWDHFS
jgi:hypothetical protein